MRIHFFQPPAEQRIGGLDAAIQSLRAALEALGAAVDEAAPDGKGDEIVHFHGLWQLAHARAAAECRARGIPCLVSPHGMLEPWAWRHKRWKKWPYFHLVEKRWISRADALLATAPGEARRLREFFPQQRIETLPLGLTGDARPDYENARRNLNWRPEARVLLFLSRIHVKKGLDLLLRALASMPFPPQTRLVIVGEGDETYVNELRRFAREHSARLPRIDWAGGVWGDARWLYFQGADLFCLPTHSENFGLAVLEALQTGTPALTTMDTPWAEDLRGGRGWIGSPSVESIREMLEDFFQKPAATADQRKELSDWAWANFDWKILGRQYLKLYEDLVRQERFEELQKEIGQGLELTPVQRIDEIVRRVLPPDDSSLQWSAVSGRISENLAGTEATTPQDIEARLSYAYLHAVASHAGFVCRPAMPDEDKEGIDAVIMAYGAFPGTWRTQITINIQLKAAVKTPRMMARLYRILSKASGAMISSARRQTALIDRAIHL